LKVEVPKPADDRPRLGRVGIIAVVGFAIGILWPRLAGVKLVPSPPEEEGEPAAAAEPAPEGSGNAAPALANAVPADPAAPEEPEAPAAADRVRISDAKVTSCRDDQDRRASDCDVLDLEKVAKARIQTLGACEGAAQVTGTLSLGLELDFAKKKVADVVRGKSTTIGDAESKKLIDCAKKEFESASLDGVEHKHARYTIFYIVELVPPSAAKPEAETADAASAAEEVAAASGRATVSWDVAIIRDKPKEGEIVARILRGTRVVVSGRQGDWYRIKYDAKGNEGWVFKSAIGL
jgi:hypothetical protein